MSIDKTNSDGLLANGIDNGVLVILNTHPFSKYQTNFENLPLIKDFPLVDSPIMVVGEFLINFKDVHDENSGELKIRKNSCQCKCFWYNHKSAVFEESWLEDRLLSIIPIDLENETDSNNIKINDIVSLKSLPLEKCKSSRLFETRSSGRISEIYKSNAIHNFEPPIMQVIETKKVELDEKYDIKTGRKRKFTTNKLVKCKWFNTFLNKFSEAWLPIDVLIKRPCVDDESIKIISDCIQNKKVIKTSEFLLRPLGINSDGFYWNVEGVNLFTNLYLSIGLKKLIGMELIEEKDSFFAFYNCRNIKVDELAIPIDGAIEEKEWLKKVTLLVIKREIERYKGNRAIRILYKNLKGALSMRVLTDYYFDDQLLIAFCHLKGDVRKFNLLSIRSIEAVEFPYLFYKAT